MRFVRGRKNSKYQTLVASAVVFALIVCACVFGVGSISDTADRRAQESLENALSRSIAYCYATEGRYPQDLQYIEEHYGLLYDRDRFYVDYRIVGSNLYPDVTIIDKEASQ